MYMYVDGWVVRVRQLVQDFVQDFNLVSMSQPAGFHTEGGDPPNILDFQTFNKLRADNYREYMCP